MSADLYDPGPEPGHGVAHGVAGPLRHREVDHQLLGALLPIHVATITHKLSTSSPFINLLTWQQKYSPASLLLGEARCPL